MTNNINFDELCKKLYIDKLNIPDIITEEWLTTQLENNNLFKIYGFSNIDLSDKKFDKNISKEILRKIAFNNKTILPEDSPIKFNESLYGVDDEIKKIHEMGITGEGINVAVIDQPMLKIHNEIKESLVSFTDNATNKKEEMHGTVVTGLLTGKTTGIAPKARLHYFQVDSSSVEKYINGVIKSLEDIYKLNEKGENIKVVNISGSTIYDINGNYQPKVYDLIIKLKEQGCYVIDSNVFSKSNFTCINKNYQNNEYYYSDWQKEYEEIFKKRIAIPTGGKIYPFPYTESDYWYKSDSSYSWSIPKLSGLFVLCLEVNPKLTYEDFVRISNETKITNQNGITIINPEGIIELVKEMNKTL